MVPKGIRKMVEKAAFTAKNSANPQDFERLSVILNDINVATDGNMGAIEYTLKQAGLTNAQANMLISYVGHPDKDLGMQMSKAMFYDYGKIWGKDSPQAEELADRWEKAQEKLAPFYQMLSKLDPKNRERMTNIINQTTRQMLAYGIDNDLFKLNDPMMMWLTGRGPNRFLNQVFQRAGFDPDRFVPQKVDDPHSITDTVQSVYLPPGGKERGLNNFREYWKKRIIENPEAAGITGYSKENKVKKQNN